MPSRVRQWALALAQRIRLRKGQTAVALVAVALAVYVVVYPFFVTTYPPITDLPFHAAETSILRHYLDPTWHFREQFTLQFFQAPYASMYVVGWFFSLFLPIAVATKLMAITMLGLMP